MSNERGQGAFLFLAGLTVGAALGVLFAPQSGKETREDIGERGRKAKADLDELVAEGQERWREAKGKVKEKATMTREEVDDLLKYLFEEGRDPWDRVKHQTHKSSADV